MVESIFFHPWVWIIPIVLAVLILAVVFDLVYFVTEGVLTLTAGLALMALGAVYFGFMLPPYDASYYQTYRITGEVASIEKAFDADGGTLSQTFIVDVEGVDLYISSDDQRFRAVEKGDEVNLVCNKQFRYFVTPWYDCSFGG